MTDFYEELKLDRSQNVSELNRELSRQESVWKRRELTSPEKATRIVAVILEARKAFRDEVTRAGYDRELDASRQAPAEEDPDAARAASFRKWYDDALRYRDSGEADLAQMAIEKAAGLMDPRREDPGVFMTAASINRQAGALSAALNYINRAIVLCDADPAPYVEKGQILDAQRLEEAKRSHADRDRVRELVIASRGALLSAVQKARAAGRDRDLDHAAGCLAWSCYHLDPVDKGLAEEYAKESERLGDSWNNAKAVLGRIGAERAQSEAAARAEQERRDAAARAEQERREAAARDERERQRALRQTKARRRCAVLVLLALFVLGGLSGLLWLRWQSTSIGAGIRYAFDADTGTLSVSGSGETRDYPDVFFFPPWEMRRTYHFSGLCQAVAPLGFEAEDVRHLEFSDGITKIGDELFNGFSITELTIPESVRSIGKCSFEKNPGLQDVTLSASVEWVDTSAFAHSGDGGLVIHYGGTLLQWAGISESASADPGGFNLRGAGEVQCSDGRILRGGTDSYAVTTSVEYSGTMQQWEEQFGGLLGELAAKEGYDPSAADFSWAAVFSDSLAMGTDLSRIVCADGTLYEAPANNN